MKKRKGNFMLVTGMPKCFKNIIKTIINQVFKLNVNPECNLYMQDNNVSSCIYIKYKKKQTGFRHH